MSLKQVDLANATGIEDICRLQGRVKEINDLIFEFKSVGSK
jgi:hypothetical protein